VCADGLGLSACPGCCPESSAISALLVPLPGGSGRCCIAEPPVVCLSLRASKRYRLMRTHMVWATGVPALQSVQAALQSQNGGQGRVGNCRCAGRHCPPPFVHPPVRVAGIPGIARTAGAVRDLPCRELRHEERWFVRRRGAKARDRSLPQAPWDPHYPPSEVGGKWVRMRVPGRGLWRLASHGGAAWGNRDP
jgi:hypothetical protein